MFNFAYLAQEIKNAYYEFVSDEALINALLEYFIYSGHIKSQDGNPYQVDKRTASNIIKSKVNLIKPIKEFISKRDFSESEFIKDFDSRVYKSLDLNKVEILINKLNKELLPNEDIVSPTLKAQLTKSFKSQNYSEYLALVFKLSITLNNKIKKEISEDCSITKIDNIKNTLLSQGEIPNKPTKEEIPYINAIKKALNDKYQKTNQQKNAEHDRIMINRHRSSFFMADLVKRKCREIYDLDTEESPFEELEQEIYDGIIETYDKEYQNGYDRLVASLEQATRLNCGSTLLERETRWVTEKTKKGCCHYLVNDEYIKGWNDEDLI